MAGHGLRYAFDSHSESLHLICVAFLGNLKINSLVVNLLISVVFIGHLKRVL